MEWHGERLALLLWAKKEDGADDVMRYLGDVRVVDGAASFWTGAERVLDLPEKWLRLIQPAPSKLADILGDATWLLSLSVGEVEDGGPGLEKTGLKWPTSGEPG